MTCVCGEAVAHRASDSKTQARCPVWEVVSVRVSQIKHKQVKCFSLRSIKQTKCALKHAAVYFFPLKESFEVETSKKHLIVTTFYDKE